MKFKRCEQRRRDCFGCLNGKCVVLNSTHFSKMGKTYKCPFYKPKKDVDNSVIELVENEDDIDEDTELDN